ncbi:hypothetical protein SBA7_830002 [Candidatus Sulfotelmatobacter sp. SbA7]|nr:hypothetical protein SBA7_830002 [Candidatus Sulfotelmatobacter sp. SbA7]
MIGPSGHLKCKTVLPFVLDLAFRSPDGPMLSALFNTPEEKFVEKRELNLVTFC